MRPTNVAQHVWGANMAQKLSASEKLELARKEADKAGLFFFRRSNGFILCRKGSGIVGTRSSEDGLLSLVRRSMRRA